MRRALPWLLLTAALAGCTSLQPPVSERLGGLGATPLLLLGEQHDAAQHQQVHQGAVEALAARGQLAAVALEMADQGATTAGLPRDATEAAVQAALRWQDAGWPWGPYGPAVMAAVRAGVPVVGANLPRDGMRAALADATLDARLAPELLRQQRAAVRDGHCGLLPEAQLPALARVQIARDLAMARTVTELAMAPAAASPAAPGKTVLLIAGSGHVDRLLGVPQHLPPQLAYRAVKLQPRNGAPVVDSERRFHAVWVTARVPEKDYCAEMRQFLKPPAAAR